MLEKSRGTCSEKYQRNGYCYSGRLSQHLIWVESCFDVITAGTTLHHLRGDEEWELVFGKISRALKPGGTFWINDIVIGETDEITQMMIDGWKSILQNEQVGNDTIDFLPAEIRIERIRLVPCRISLI